MSCVFCDGDGGVTEDVDFRNGECLSHLLKVAVGLPEPLAMISLCLTREETTTLKMGWDRASMGRPGAASAEGGGGGEVEGGEGRVSERKG